jgi:hypothetical protein
MATVTADTVRLLQQATSRLDELHHRLAAAEERKARERRDARARADAAEHLRSREHLLELQSVARQYQARADSAFETWNMRAPAYVVGESLDQYRRRLVKLAQRQLPDDHRLRHIPIKRLDDDILNGYEQEIFADCKEAGTRPDSAAPGELREVVTINPQNGQKTITFLGNRSFVLTSRPRYARSPLFGPSKGRLVPQGSICVDEQRGGSSSVVSPSRRRISKCVRRRKTSNRTSSGNASCVAGDILGGSAIESAVPEGQTCASWSYQNLEIDVDDKGPRWVTRFVNEWGAVGTKKIGEWRYLASRRSGS